MTRRAYHVLIDVLRDEGVTHVFGNPGSTEMPLMDALVDAPDVAYVLGLQEATAVAMADGWALASGKVGFVNLHAMGGLATRWGRWSPARRAKRRWSSPPASRTRVICRASRGSPAIWSRSLRRR